MDDLIWRARITPTRCICVSPLSSLTIQESGTDNLGGDSGYFIYEVDEGPQSAGIQVLGKAASEEAAMRLVDIFLSRRPRRTTRRRAA